MIVTALLLLNAQAYDGDPGKVHACVGAGGQVRVVAAEGFGNPYNDCSALPGFWIPIHLDSDWSGHGTGAMYNTALTDLVGIGTSSPQHPLDVHGDVRTDGRFAAGNTAGIGFDGSYYDRIFDLSHTIQDFSTAPGWIPFKSYIGIDPQMDLTGADQREIYGVDMSTWITAGNPHDLYHVNGQYFGTFHDGTGHVDLLYGTLMVVETSVGDVGSQVGAWAISDVRASGSVADNTALAVRAGHRGDSGSVGVNRGILVQSPEASQPLGVNYGVYVEAQDAGATSYALYTEPSDVYLGGPVGVGTSTPASALQVRGYTQLDVTAGRPPAADCDAASERGRMKVDAAASLLYVCMNTGWVGK